MVQQAGISAADFVVEIGPGLGAITEPLLATGARVLAIEKDGRLADFLRYRFANRRLEIMHGDALEFDVKRLFPAGPVKLLGNLPYYASTQLLLRYLDPPTPIRVAVLMLQKEVAARLSASPAFQRLRNSYPGRPGSVPRRIFAHRSGERLFAATRCRFRFHPFDSACA